MIPKISLILSIRSPQRYLSQTIESIRNQTMEDYEVILVHGCSVDDLLTSIDDAVKEDSRFRCLCVQDFSDGFARNCAMDTAKGEYVIFSVGADIYEPEFLEKCYQKAACTRADIVACNFIGLDERGKRTRKTGIHTEWIPAGCNVFSYQECPLNILRVTTSEIRNKLYRRDFLQRKGLRFDERLTCSEISFVAVSQAVAERIAYSTEYLMSCRLHAQYVGDGMKDVRDAVLGAVRFMNSLPHSGIIQNAIAKFMVENYLNALKYGVSEFRSTEAADLYNTVHDTFTGPLADLQPEDINNGILYREYLTVRKHDYEAMRRLSSRRLIVSLTTYPRRIGSIPAVLESIYSQTRKADEIVLWLAEEQFPGKEKDLPVELLKLAEEGRLTVHWCDDLKPHKKYFYALQKYSDDLVVTIDDDLLYSRDMLASLYASYLLYPNAVSTVRAHLIMVDEQNQIMPYNTWIQETDNCIHKPSMQLMATSGAGVLYPPGLFRREFFDAEAIRENCLWADDLWLKAMQVVSGVPVVVARPHEQLQYLPGTQEEALYHVNVRQNQNDVQLANISAWLDKTFEPGILIRKLTQWDGGERIIGINAVSYHLDRERKNNRRKYLQADTKLGQVEQQKRDTETKLARANESIKQASTEIRQLQSEQNKLERKLQQTQQTLQQTELTLRKTQENLTHTNEQLRWTRDHMPIGVQMRDLGEFLRQKRKSSNLLLWGCKYAIYLCGWIPLKLLTGTMYFLKNGFKATAKRTISKLFRRG